ncbi:MAG: hydroxyethylthiazole kinase [Oscillospiraceae bacterium]|nr:hydroxyethylthiazole kinase [Oscillospiraceae bacterium]
MLSQMLKNVREKHPLIHNITNYVTVNDCANILLACGGSPIMSDDPQDAVEITAICGGLNINIGTLNARTIPSMFSAGKRANELSHPVILDPVGAGASTIRTETANRLLDEVKFSVIRGNISEIKTLALGIGNTQGVDASSLDAVTADNIDSVIAFAREFSEKTGAVIAITGATDIVSDKDKTYVITNGVKMMADITGSGCMLTAMAAAYITANPDDVLKATAASVCAMGLCGEKAYETVTKNGEGNSSFRNRLIDCVYNLTPDELEKGAKYELR